MLTELPFLAQIDDGLFFSQVLHLHVTVRLLYFLRGSFHDRTLPCIVAVGKAIWSAFGRYLGYVEGFEGAAVNAGACIRFGLVIEHEIYGISANEK